MGHAEQEQNVYALDRGQAAERSGNPLIKETPKATLSAIRDFAHLLCVGVMLDADQPQGLALGLQVLLGALNADVLKKVPHE